MVTALISSKELKSDALNSIISKKLDNINGVQIALDKKGGVIVYSLDYPTSVNAMMRALSIADDAIFVINDEITAIDAELALAVENSDIDTVIPVKLEYSDESSFSKLFGNYKVGRSKIITMKEAAELPKIERRSPDFSYVSVDKHFIVKGIGSVIIGFNLGGTVKKGDKLHLLPTLKDVSIKSIQIMDVDSQTASSGQHVGLALNNINGEDLSENYAVSSIGSVAEKFSCKFDKSKFYSIETLADRDLGCALLGKNFSVSIEEADTSIRFNRPVPKIGGKHLIMDASLSVGKNRVVGSFEFA